MFAVMKKFVDVFNILNGIEGIDVNVQNKKGILILLI